MTAGTPALPPLPPKWSGKFRPLAAVEAVQLTDWNRAEVVTWIEAGGGRTEIPFAEPCLYVDTPRGPKRAGTGDWVVKGVTGEFFPVEPGMFETAYEPAEAAAPAPGLTVATFGYDGCLTPGAVYATYIGSGRLSVTVEFGRELPISEDDAERLDGAIHDALERLLAPYWGADACEQPAPVREREALEDIARAIQGATDTSGPLDRDWLVSRAVYGLGQLPADAAAVLSPHYHTAAIACRDCWLEKAMEENAQLADDNERLREQAVKPSDDVKPAPELAALGRVARLARDLQAEAEQISPGGRGSLHDIAWADALRSCAHSIQKTIGPDVKPQPAPGDTDVLYLSAIARLSLGLRDVQQACERGDASYAIAPVAADALADVGRLQLPQPQPEPGLGLASDETIQ